MNRNSRTIRLIEASFHRIGLVAASGDRAEVDALEAAALEAVGLLDELRRLERKWRAQVEGGSGRRLPSDFREMEGWYRQWLGVVRVLLRRADGAALANPAVRAQLATLSAEVERKLRDS